MTFPSRKVALDRAKLLIDALALAMSALDEIATTGCDRCDVQRKARGAVCLIELIVTEP
jgi:hypothetical protein